MITNSIFSAKPGLVVTLQAGLFNTLSQFFPKKVTVIFHLKKDNSIFVSLTFQGE